MRDSIHEDMAVKVDVNGEWKETLRIVAHAHRSLLIAHPWLIPELAESPAALGAAITTVENMATVLRKAGFAPVDIRSIIGAIDVIIIGASIDWFAPPELFPPEVIDRSTDLAIAIRATPRHEHRADAVFNFTIASLIDSLERRLSTQIG